MASLTLVVMAAGVGSRYGGLKQMDGLGPSGEVVMEYSVYDALRSGFDRAVFIIRRDFEEAFRDRVGRKVEGAVETAYVFQSLDQVPAGFAVPPGRVKPWGTGQAVLAAREAARTPFAVINADDFYGREAFEIMAGELRRPRPADGASQYAMLGYRLANTLSEHGHVARGLCESTPDGYLRSIRELLKIQRRDGRVRHTEDDAAWLDLAEDSLVSMNFWGFEPSIFGELETQFREFLAGRAADLAKAEFLIPEAVGRLVREGKARVRVLPTPGRWFGVTYPADRPLVEEAIRERVRRGLYPPDLWSKT